jgi:hypothetical protein
MYYILNETNHVIATDNALLTLCKASDTDALIYLIAKKEIEFEIQNDESLLLKNHDDTQHFNIQKISLSSLLGNLTLIKLLDTQTSNIEDKDTPEENLLLEEDVSLDALHEESISINDDKVVDNKENIPVDEISENNKKMDISNNTVVDDLVMESDSEGQENDILYDLIDESDTKSETIKTEEIPTDTDINDIDINVEKEDFLVESTEQTPTSDIVININQVSQIIGISPQDYNAYLNEFIDTALNLEKDLQNKTSTKYKNAIETLSHLSKMLHLPKLGEIIDEIEKNNTSVESFYTALSCITVRNEDKAIDTLDTTESSTIIHESSSDESDEKIDLLDEVDIDTPTIQPKKAKSENSFGTISLDDVKPKHFDFQLEEAAKDLSLPVELIEEFVHDFIEQAHVETKRMLQAYEEGDLETIQKIGHLLKGASSNLRIVPLSDTLYQIQFCEDVNMLESLIKNYWAHFLSFENQINVISH